MSDIMNFNYTYYDDLMKRYDYKPVDSLQGVGLKGVSPEVMKTKWLCHSGIDPKASLNDTIIASGIATNNAPHMGTLSQILKIIYLQKQGCNVQFTLADFYAYNSRNQDMADIKKLEKRYEKFIVGLGFDKTKGKLANQSDDIELFRTAFLASNHFNDEDFYDVEEDLAGLYKKMKIHNGMTFSCKQGVLLNIALWLDPGMNKGYKNAIIMLGIDEHQDVRLTNKIKDRMGLDFNVSGLYSKMIKGLNGFPKMSKSLKGSSINVEMGAEKIRKLLLNEKDDYTDPQDSVLFQLMANVSHYNDEEIEKLHTLCKNKGAQWQNAKQNYSDMLIGICSKWKDSEY